MGYFNFNKRVKKIKPERHYFPRDEFGHSVLDKSSKKTLGELTYDEAGNRELRAKNDCLIYSDRKEHDACKTGFRKGVDYSEDILREDLIMKDIGLGRYRRRFGLDTTSGSLYNYYRERGLSDVKAQYKVYKSRGLI